MPTSTQAQKFSNYKLEPAQNPGMAMIRNVKLPVSVSYKAGTLVGEVSATPGTFKAYASGSVDGSQIVKGILVYDVATDASGNVSLTQTAGNVGGEFGQQQPYAGIYIRGMFYTQDLPQSGAGSIDAASMTTTGSQLILKNGTTALGMVELI